MIERRGYFDRPNGTDHWGLISPPHVTNPQGGGGREGTKTVSIFPPFFSHRLPTVYHPHQFFLSISPHQLYSNPPPLHKVPGRAAEKPTHEIVMEFPSSNYFLGALGVGWVSPHFQLKRFHLLYIAPPPLSLVGRTYVRWAFSGIQCLFVSLSRPPPPSLPGYLYRLPELPPGGNNVEGVKIVLAPLLGESNIPPSAFLEATIFAPE